MRREAAHFPTFSLSHRLPCPRSQSDTGAPRIYFFSKKGFAEGGTGSLGVGLR